MLQKSKQIVPFFKKRKKHKEEMYNKNYYLYK